MTLSISLNCENLSKANWLTLREHTQPCLTVEQIRKVETQAFGMVDSWLLMQAAGIRSAQKILELFEQQTIGQKQCVVLAGPGNNGGDAMVVASELSKSGADVQLVEFSNDGDGSKDRQKARTLCQKEKITFIKPHQMKLQQACVVVDGLLGIGCTRAPEKEMAQCIEAINSARTTGHLLANRPSITVVALDCPSGLNCTTGDCEGVAIHADLTLTYIALKTGLLCNQGRDQAGRVLTDSLGCESLLVNLTQVKTQADKKYLTYLPQRGHQNHKGSFGSLAVIGGAPGMIGAVILASRAAIVLGTGRVAISLLHESDRSSLLDLAYPEIMNKTVKENQEFANTYVIGPGLSDAEEAQNLLQRLLSESYDTPMVLDADALNLLAANSDLRHQLAKQRTNPDTCSGMVLTPHPQEAARLLNRDSKWVNANRIEASQKLSEEFNCVTVLKGSGTVISDRSSCLINCTGGPALATAGSGDVLAGVIGAFMAQGISDFHAAATAVWLHGCSVEANGFHQAPLIVSHASEITLRMKELFNHLLYQRTSGYC